MSIECVSIYTTLVKYESDYDVAVVDDDDDRYFELFTGIKSVKSDYRYHNHKQNVKTLGIGLRSSGLKQEHIINLAE